MNEADAMGHARSLVAEFADYDGEPLPGYDEDLVREIAVYPRVFDYLLTESHFDAVLSLVEAYGYVPLNPERGQMSAMLIGCPGDVFGRPVNGVDLLEGIRSLVRRCAGQPGVQPKRADRPTYLYPDEFPRELRLALVEFLRDSWQADTLVVDFPRRRSQI